MSASRPTPPCPFRGTPSLTGRKLHSCLSFRPVNTGGVAKVGPGALGGVTSDG